MSLFFNFLFVFFVFVVEMENTCFSFRFSFLKFVTHFMLSRNFISRLFYLIFFTFPSATANKFFSVVHLLETCEVLSLSLSTHQLRSFNFWWL